MIYSEKGKDVPSNTFNQARFAYGNNYIDRWPFIKRYQSLWLEGMKWYPTWRDQSKYLNPTRGFFFNEVPDRGNPIDHVTLIDSACRRYIRDFASGMISGMSSPSRKWRKMELEDQDLMGYEPVKLYFQQVDKIMDAVSSHSNMYDGLHNIYEEIVSFGTAAAALLEDYEDVIRMRNFTIGEYFLGSGPDCRVNAFVRPFWMTCTQLVEKYGYENCSPTVQQMYNNNQADTWRRIIHLIEINDDRIPDYADFGHKHTREIYWEDGSPQNTYLELGGYNEFPMLTPRWQTKTSSDNYGRSPGWDVLGDSKMLQIMQKKKLIALDKTVDPPLQADSNIGTVNTLPGGITRYSSASPNAGVKPTYQVQIDFNAVREDILEVKEALKDAFFNDLFKMVLAQPDNPNETAYAIAEKQAERLNMLSPIVDKLNNELLNPLNIRQYNICNRAGLFPPMPKELKGQKIQVKYVSVLSQAQRMAGITAKTQAIGFIAQNGQVFPGMADIPNVDNITRNYMEELGLEPDEINSPDTVMAARKQKAEQVAKAQQQQTAINMAEAAAKGGKAVKDMASAPMDGNNALTSMLSGITGKQ